MRIIILSFTIRHCCCKGAGKKRRLLVVGIADGFEEALYLVEKIAQEVYDVTGDMKIRKYLLEQQKKFEEGKV